MEQFADVKTLNLLHEFGAKSSLKPRVKSMRFMPRPLRRRTSVRATVGEQTRMAK